MFDNDSTESELHKYAEGYELIRENAEFYDVPEKKVEEPETQEKAAKDLSEEEIDLALGELYEAGYIDENCNLLSIKEGEITPARRLFDKLTELSQ